jgi:hypothetical protein
MRKMTFTLDEATAREIDRAADRLDIPKSQVVREAVQLYGEQLGRLSDEERRDRLAAFDALVPSLPARPRDAVEQELAEVRRARRRGGRGTSVG